MAKSTTKTKTSKAAKDTGAATRKTGSPEGDGRDSYDARVQRQEGYYNEVGTFVRAEDDPAHPANAVLPLDEPSEPAEEK